MSRVRKRSLPSVKDAISEYRSCVPGAVERWHAVVLREIKTVVSSCVFAQMADKEELVSTILLRMTPDLDAIARRADLGRNPAAMLKKHIYRLLKRIWRPEVTKDEQFQAVYDWNQTISPKTVDPADVLRHDEIRRRLARKAVETVSRFRFPVFRPAFRQYVLAVLEVGETEPPTRFQRYAIPEGVQGVMRYWLRRGLKEWLNGWA